MSENNLLEQKASAARGCAPATCSASRVVVTQSMVNEIVRRAKDSQWGLSEEPKASLSLLFYEAAPMDALALVLVNGFEAKYDLVSIFSAALSVIAEQTPNSVISNGVAKTEKANGLDKTT